MSYRANKNPAVTDVQTDVSYVRMHGQTWRIHRLG